MNIELFRKRGKEMVDYAANYLETIRKRRPFPNWQPGHLIGLLPNKAPSDPDKWEDVMSDVTQLIMPGVVHWMSPQFHAYYPLQSSYPAMTADILINAIGAPAFSWASCPAATELEMITMDWLGKMVDLPDDFLFCSGGKGGGVIQASASESTLLAILCAKMKKLREVTGCYIQNDFSDCGQVFTKLIAYCSDQTHSSVEKTAMMGFVNLHILPSDDDGVLRGSTVKEAIEMDKSMGLIPFYICCTIGTTPLSACDELTEIGKICTSESIWMHIDGAYAGNACICPEIRPVLNGVEYATTFMFSPHKWLKVNMECTAMWIKDRELLSEAFKVNPTYFRHSYEGHVPDYRHWHIQSVKKFRALKLWFVLRLFGQRQLQEFIRQDIKHALQFKKLVEHDPNFEVVNEVKFGLVCFRMKGPNQRSMNLMDNLKTDGRLHLVPATHRSKYFLRFVVCSNQTASSDIFSAWNVIQSLSKLC